MRKVIISKGCVSVNMIIPECLHTASLFLACILTFIIAIQSQNKGEVNNISYLAAIIFSLFVTFISTFPQKLVTEASNCTHTHTCVCVMCKYTQILAQCLRSNIVILPLLCQELLESCKRNFNFLHIIFMVVVSKFLTQEHSS